jgi:hypothetical protein
MVRNQRKSRLLRLPGELRNKIYEYTFSDAIVSVFRSSKLPGYVEMKPHIRSRASYRTTTPDNLVALTKTCRQIFAESRLLLFRLVTFHVHSDGSLGHFLKTLESSQQDVITTVQITTQDANVGGMLLDRVTKYLSNDLAYQADHLDLLEWMESLPFDRLPGLRRMVVEEDQQWTYKSAGEATLQAGISHCLKGRDVEIVVPPSVA